MRMRTVCLVVLLALGALADKPACKGARDYTVTVGGVSVQVREGFYNSSVPGFGSAQLFYRLYGNPEASTYPPVLIHHGVTSASSLFHSLALELASEGRVVLAHDARGCGFTQQYTPFYDHATYAEDWHRLANGLKLRAPRDVLAWSYGGPAAQTLYNRYPAEVRSLVLFDTTCSYLNTPGYDGFPYAINPFFYNNILLPSYRANGTQAIIDSVHQRILSDPEVGASDPLRATLVEVALQTSPAAALGQYEAFVQFDNHANLRNISVPVLLLYGDRDLIFNTSVAHYMHERIPNSQLVFFHGRDHSAFATVASDFAAEVKRFLRTLAAPLALRVAHSIPRPALESAAALCPQWVAIINRPGFY